MTENNKSSKEIMWVRTYKNLEDSEQLYSLFEEIIQSKYNQRQTEEKLLGMINRPIHKKWLHERVLDQYKHERMLKDIVKGCLGKEIILNKEERTLIQGSGLQEMNKRLEEVAVNIQFISLLSQPIQDFELYKMLQAMLSDEYIYQSRLVRILLEK